MSIFDESGTICKLVETIHKHLHKLLWCLFRPIRVLEKNLPMVSELDFITIFFNRNGFIFIFHGGDDKPIANCKVSSKGVVVALSKFSFGLPI